MVTVTWDGGGESFCIVTASRAWTLKLAKSFWLVFALRERELLFYLFICFCVPFRHGQVSHLSSRFVPLARRHGGNTRRQDIEEPPSGEAEIWDQVALSGEAIFNQPR